MSVLGGIYQDQGKYAEAEPLVIGAWETWRRKQGPDHPETLTALINVAMFYQAQGQFAKAEPLLIQALEGNRRLLGPEHPEIARLLFDLGVNRLRQQKHAEAEPPLRECRAICDKKLPDDWRRFQTQSQLGASLLGQKKYTEAEPFLRGAYEGLKERKDRIPPGNNALTAACEGLVELYEATGQEDQADAWRKKREALPPPKPPVKP
jgi:tetratricopeptide (TPR) repeat protein